MHFFQVIRKHENHCSTIQWILHGFIRLLSPFMRFSYTYGFDPWLCVQAFSLGVNGSKRLQRCGKQMASVWKLSTNGGSSTSMLLYNRESQLFLTCVDCVWLCKSSKDWIVQRVPSPWPNLHTCGVSTRLQILNISTQQNTLKRNSTWRSRQTTETTLLETQKKSHKYI